MVLPATGVAMPERRASTVAARQVPPRTGSGGVVVKTSELGAFKTVSGCVVPESGGAAAVNV